MARLMDLLLHISVHHQVLCPTANLRILPRLNMLDNLQLESRLDK